MVMKMTMQKIEENFISITDYIKNCTSATTIDMKIHWLRLIWCTCAELKNEIEDELKLGE